MMRGAVVASGVSGKRACGLEPLDQVEARVELAVADREQRAAALRALEAELGRDVVGPHDVAVVAQHAEPDRGVELDRALERCDREREVEQRERLPGAPSV